MTKKILSIILTASAAAQIYAAPAGDWKVYPTFDRNVLKVVDTPSKTYFQVLGQNVRTSGISTPFRTPYPFLFAYDKGAYELEGLSRRNLLSDNLPSFINYNPDKKYLFIGYSNGNIDLLTDEGRHINIPALTTMSFSTGKEVNSVSFDAENSCVYVALPFGYIVIDDKKGEVPQSCVFNSAVTGICRTGDNILISDGEVLKVLPASERYPRPEAFSVVNGLKKVSELQPLEGGKFLALVQGRLYTALLDNGNVSGLTDITPAELSGFTGLIPNRDGYLAVSSNGLAQITKTGTTTGVIPTKISDNGVPGTWDFSEIWFAEERKGLSSSRYDSGEWTVTREAMMPNAPGVFRATDMLVHPAKGVLVIDHGYHTALQGRDDNTQSHLSGFKNGEWERLAPAYTKPEWSDAHRLPLGLALDPDDSRYVYSGSYYSGLVRYNVDDPDDLVRFSSSGDQFPNQASRIVEILPLNPNMSTYNLAAYPSFDAQGNLWIGTGHTYTTGPRAKEFLMVWPAEARKKGDMSAWTSIEVPDWKANWAQLTQALTHPSNSGIVLSAGGDYGAPILVYDCNKTPELTTDDRMTTLGTIYDAGGTNVAQHYIYKFWEDPQTGLVWTLTDVGLFTFNPRNAFNDNTRVNRIKVARNDGTNLADYLLDGVPVYTLTTDASGRKYFGTGGGGIVVTTSSGDEILGQYTKENSYLPSDIVYGLEYNPATRSIMVSTSEGICEFFPAGTSSGQQKEDSLTIYPNPVRPDYYGWITITGLDDISLVKIVDAAGNLVCELGHPSAGTVQWDGSNMDHKRVRSGVYYVMASGADGSGTTRMGKILVVN